MTPQDIALVQDSFRKVVPIADTAADIFYQRLFETNPELRALFPPLMADQKAKLMKSLAVAVGSLHDLDNVIPAVQRLGVKHLDYDVEDTHFDAVGAALLYTLEKGLGADWTPQLAEAWTQTYLLVSNTMIDAAHKAMPQ